MKIVLVRHGETDYNRLHIIQGHQPVSLNERGRKQAQELGESLKAEKFTHFYCSGLKRAKETAEIINRNFNLPLIYDNRLNERNVGEWENKKIDEFPEYRGLDVLGLDENPYHGETIRQVIDRCLEFTHHLTQKHHNSDVVLVVTHGGPVKIISGFVNGINPENYFKQSDIVNGQITRITYENSEFTIR
ncbi:MAG: histidine phosphatase family protein [Dehalococcoidales bacterium]|nr:histidine phosphatase family protein [Dehalococcoidales bacterium]